MQREYKEYIEREEAKELFRIWISDCVLDGDNDAADCFRDCIDLLDSIPAADVEIMLSQLKIIFGDWSDWKHYKMDRLEERINAINGTKENDC